jgi:type II secretory pathway pseudopilin PulG
MAFGKRFPIGLSKEFLLKEAKVSKMVPLEASWQTIFAQLEHRPKDLTRVLKTAVDMRPDDRNLCEIVEIMCPPAPIGWFATVASVISLGILASIAFPQESSTTNAFAHAEQTQADLAAMKRFEQASFTQEMETITTEASEPVLLPDAGPEERTPGSARKLEETFATLTPVPTPVYEANATENTVAIKQSQSQGLSTPKRCNIEGSGEIIGYWYAGANPPEVMNGWTTIPHGMNVRLDYPERHNAYNAKAPVSCVLFPNMEVPVLDEPILVAGGKYWVALRSIPRG